MTTTRAAGYAAASAGSPLAPFAFARREPGPRDVELEILFCGVCHSDLHTARGEWGGTVYPVVPGHEIVGRVTRAGAEVSRVQPGELAAVGCMVDSCRTCGSCREGLEQYCENGAVYTYNSHDPVLDGVTYGGYSNRIVVTEDFVLRLPAGLDPAAAAPLLCAGITTYSPLRTWRTGPGSRVGVVGLGGLGHMAVKLARAMGADVVLFTTSPGKAEDALRLGATEVVISRDRPAMKGQRARLDFVLDTVAVPHDLNPYLDVLRRDGALCLVGIPPEPHPSPSAGKLINQRRRLTGSSIGGIAETQEMLDFCATYRLAADIELIAMHDINDAYERMLRSDVRYRFVIDMATLTA
jgi:uncharacterized zinc-type alcohol dehydrogenase-like protein